MGGIAGKTSVELAVRGGELQLSTSLGFRSDRGTKQPCGVWRLQTQMGSQSSVRMTWSEICLNGEYRGRWVALDGVRYDEATAKPVEGAVVDADNDLAELCNRIRHSNRRCCAILFCDAHESAATHALRQRPRAAVNH